MHTFNLFDTQTQSYILDEVSESPMTLRQLLQKGVDHFITSVEEDDKFGENPLDAYLVIAKRDKLKAVKMMYFDMYKNKVEDFFGEYGVVIEIEEEVPNPIFYGGGGVLLTEVANLFGSRVMAILLMFFTLTCSAQIPTAKDSLALYQNSKAILEYFSDTNAYPPVYTMHLDPMFAFHTIASQLQTIKECNILFGTDFIRNTLRYRAVIDSSLFYREIDSNKFMQMVCTSGAIYIENPLYILYDKRIAPTKEVVIGRVYTNWVSDNYWFSVYDPVFIKPFALLTWDEYHERVYGIR